VPAGIRRRACTARAGRPATSSRKPRSAARSSGCWAAAHSRQGRPARTPIGPGCLGDSLDPTHDRWLIVEQVGIDSEVADDGVVGQDGDPCVRDDGHRRVAARRRVDEDVGDRQPASQVAGIPGEVAADGDDLDARQPDPAKGLVAGVVAVLRRELHGVPADAPGAQDRDLDGRPMRVPQVRPRPLQRGERGGDAVPCDAAQVLDQPPAVLVSRRSSGTAGCQRSGRASHSTGGHSGAAACVTGWARTPSPDLGRFRPRPGRTDHRPRQRVRCAELAIEVPRYVPGSRHGQHLRHRQTRRQGRRGGSGAGDGIRTRDILLGKS
jgi:hypothetical protein